MSRSRIPNSVLPYLERLKGRTLRKNVHGFYDQETKENFGFHEVQWLVDNDYVEKIFDIKKSLVYIYKVKE